MKNRRLSLFAGTVCLGLLAPFTSTAADYRIEAGVGIAHGDHNLSFSESVESFGLSIEPSSALNGAGLATTLGVWADGLFFETLSLGLEYLRFENTADLVVAARTPSQSVAVDTDFDLDIDAVMLSAAYRRNRGTIHPYVALGIGAARVAGEVDGDVAGTPIISEIGTINFSDSDYTPAIQVAIGLDYDLTERIYVGASARYFAIDALLFEQDEVIRELAATVKLGISF